MTKYAPIIYGRTYNSDFRLIVKPHDFQNDESKWVKRYILQTMRLETKQWGAKLRENPRWFMLSTEDRCVFGVTCMADMLSNTMYEDSVGRPLYVCVGYVGDDPSPTMQNCDFDVLKSEFKKIYEDYVGARWLEKPFQVNKANEKFISQYHEISILKKSGIYKENQLASPQKFNTSTKRVLLIPEPRSNAEKYKLFTAAAKAQKPISVCLGLTRDICQKLVRDEASQAGFLNIAISGIEREIYLKREISIPKPRPQPKPEPINHSVIPPRQIEPSDSVSTQGGWGEFVAGSFGALIEGVTERWLPSKEATYKRVNKYSNKNKKGESTEKGYSQLNSESLQSQENIVDRKSAQKANFENFLGKSSLQPEQTTPKRARLDDIKTDTPKPKSQENSVGSRVSAQKADYKRFLGRKVAQPEQVITSRELGLDGLEIKTLKSESREKGSGREPAQNFRHEGISLLESFLEKIQRNPKLLREIPLNRKIGWPILQSRDSEVYVVFPLFKSQPLNTGQEMLLAPSVSIKLLWANQDAMEQDVIEIITEYTEGSELDWDISIGSLPHPTLVDCATSDYQEKRRILLSLYDEVFEISQIGGDIPLELETRLKEIRDSLVESKSEKYYREILQFLDKSSI